MKHYLIEMYFDLYPKSPEFKAFFIKTMRQSFRLDMEEGEELDKHVNDLIKEVQRTCTLEYIQTGSALKTVLITELTYNEKLNMYEEKKDG